MPEADEGGETRKAPKRLLHRFELLTFGAERFVQSLSDLFSVLTEREVPYFGLVYAYWMARFYGMRLDRAAHYVEVNTNWSEELTHSAVLRAGDPRSAGAWQGDVDAELLIIALAWKRVRELVERHAAAPQRETVLTEARA